MSSRVSWIIFLVITAGLGGYYGVTFYRSEGERKAHLPGETSPGHHQIEGACEQCHTPFDGVKNDKCLKCHEHKPDRDSHRVEMFADPRNADRAGGLDAQQCVTCHREHAPDRTVAGVTIADDFCAGCHKEVFEDRPSHKGLSPTGCSDSGCHNYHDNRALYADFLRKHKDDPENKSPPRVIARFVGKDTKPLLLEDQDAPRGELSENPTVAASWGLLVAQWADSAHAQSGVNCTGCHSELDPESGGRMWTSKVDHAVCAACHPSEEAGFLKSRHGMRLAISLSPMTPATARLPMTPEAKRKHAEPGLLNRLWRVATGEKKEAEAKANELSCTSCHGAHTFRTRDAEVDAAVDACLRCHADEHSRAYKDSTHFKLWELELKGKAKEGTGVSCATCHLPREEHKDSGDVPHTRVQHNQNDNLRPNDKMLRSVCMSCHGLGFSMDALADRALIGRNFNGRPSTKSHVKSLDWVKPRSGDKSKKGE